MTTIPAQATLTLDNPDPVSLDGRVLVNAGIVLLKGAGAINMPGSTITNQAAAIFEVETDADLFISQGLGLPCRVFNNAGTFRKSGGTSSTELPPAASVAITFNNTGTLDVQSGIVSFNAPANTAGIFRAAGGTSIEVRANLSITDGAQFIGPGPTRLLTGTTTADGTLASGSLVLEGATLLGTHSLAGGLLWLSGRIGTLFGGGTTTIPASATLTLDNPTPVSLDGRLLINAGTVLLRGAGGISMPGSTIHNPRLERS